MITIDQTQMELAMGALPKGWRMELFEIMQEEHGARIDLKTNKVTKTPPTPVLAVYLKGDGKTVVGGIDTRMPFPDLGVFVRWLIGRAG